MFILNFLSLKIQDPKYMREYSFQWELRSALETSLQVPSPSEAKLSSARKGNF